MAGAINTMYALPCCEAVFGSKPYIHGYPNIYDGMTCYVAEIQLPKKIPTKAMEETTKVEIK
jgi:hypothetical protein